MKRKRLKKIWVIISVILILSLIYPSFLIIQLTSKDYSFSTSLNIIKLELRGKALQNTYSKTFEEAIIQKKLNKKYVDNYFKIDYKNQEHFITNINTLLTKGYNTPDINKIADKLDAKQIEDFSSKDYIKDISKYLEFNFFKYENLDRYIAYESDDYKEKVVYVNIGLDKKYYEDAKLITNFTESILANKYNKLDKSFEPSNIVKISKEYSMGEEYLSSTAKEAFELMANDAKKDKKYILANSAYRNYLSQEDIYNTYLKLYGKTYVNNYVASPGFSEHQTGLAVDVAAKGYNTFKASPEYIWMLENAYKYGFILRYPAGKEKITGYKAEAWHFRYVGLDVAKFIQENKITYDEYYVMYLDK